MREIPPPECTRLLKEGECLKENDYIQITSNTPWIQIREDHGLIGQEIQGNQKAYRPISSSIDFITKN